MDRYPNEWDSAGPDDELELLEDRTRPLPRAATGARRPVRASLPAAIGGAFLVAAIALGAAAGSIGRSTAPDVTTTAGAPAGGARDAAAVPGNDEDVARDGGEHPGGGAEAGMDEPKGGQPDATKTPGDAAQPTKEPTKEPDPTNQPKPTSAPEPKTLGIDLAVKGGDVVVEWTGCEPDAFVAWKVVRSTDSTIAWPRGANDVTAAALTDVERTRAVDGSAPAGTKVWYRVFGIAVVDGAKTVACQTATKAIITPKPEPTPTPAPADPTLGLTVVVRDGQPKLAWTQCAADAFDAYKVVRSKDSTVRWPLGDNDALVAVVGPDGDRVAYDKEAPSGRTLWYRVFCVDKTSDGYRVLAASPTKSVTTPEPAPKPTPVSLDFSVETSADGVVLHWQAIDSDAFTYYKVVRSRSSNPSYLPWTDGTELIGVIENPATVEFIDEPDESGIWYYRVQAVGSWDGAKILLGQTAVRSVTVE